VLLVRGTNNLAYTVRLSGRTQITRSGGVKAVVADLSVGDRLQITGQLDPTQAGYLIAESVSDESIIPLINVRGTINYVNDARNLVTVTLVASSAPLLILLDTGTAIVLPNGRRGKIDNLVRGTTVLVTGLYDQSSHILTRTTRVTVLASSA